MSRSEVPDTTPAPAALRQEFAGTGVVTLHRAFSMEEAAHISSAVWRHIERRTEVRRNDLTTWPAGEQPPCSFKGLKKHPAFRALTANRAVRSALAALFGPAGHQEPKPGAQVLVHFPEPRPSRWLLPDAWHMDTGFDLPTWPVPAVKLFAFFGSVGPGGGGTMVLPGSHRLVERYAALPDVPRRGGMKAWRPFMQQHPFLEQLLHGGRLPGGGRHLAGAVGDVGGIPIEVRELVGEPGDVVITHLHVFHSKSPNCGDRPREMLGKAVMATPGGAAADTAP